MQPWVIGADSGSRDDHSSDVLSSQVKSRDGCRCPDRERPLWGQDLPSEASVIDVAAIDGVEEAVHLQVGVGDRFLEVAAERSRRLCRRLPSACPVAVRRASAHP